MQSHSFSVKQSLLLSLANKVLGDHSKAFRCAFPESFSVAQTAVWVLRRVPESLLFRCDSISLLFAPLAVGESPYEGRTLLRLSPTLAERALPPFTSFPFSFFHRDPGYLRSRLPSTGFEVPLANVMLTRDLAGPEVFSPTLPRMVVGIDDRLGIDSLARRMV